MSLWLVYWAFKLVTGKEGMGFGDFKLFAALGAWFGWQALIPIILPRIIRKRKIHRAAHLRITDSIR
jgi:prepilin signal peptidase PulO-like enzyme (type II secretory pathway)